MTSATRRKLRLYGRHIALALISGIAALISVGSNYLYDSMKAWLTVRTTRCQTLECTTGLADQQSDFLDGLFYGGGLGLLGVSTAAFLAIPYAQKTFRGSTARIWRVSCPHSYAIPGQGHGLVRDGQSNRVPGKRR